MGHTQESASDILILEYIVQKYAYFYLSNSLRHFIPLKWINHPVAYLVKILSLLCFIVPWHHIAGSGSNRIVDLPHNEHSNVNSYLTGLHLTLIEAQVLDTGALADYGHDFERYPLHPPEVKRPTISASRSQATSLTNQIQTSS